MVLVFRLEVVGLARHTVLAAHGVVPGLVAPVVDGLLPAPVLQGGRDEAARGVAGLGQVAPPGGDRADEATALRLLALVAPPGRPATPGLATAPALSGEDGTVLVALGLGPYGRHVGVGRLRPVLVALGTRAGPGVGHSKTHFEDN